MAAIGYSCTYTATEVFDKSNLQQPAYWNITNKPSTTKNSRKVFLMFFPIFVYFLYIFCVCMPCPHIFVRMEMVLFVKK